MKALPSFGRFVLRIVVFAALCALALVCLGIQDSVAQVSDAERANYADALAYCRGDVVRPMALRPDKRVLCLDGQIFPQNEIWLSQGLEQGGLFVVRSEGGDVAAAIALAEMLLLKEATVIVNDYCLAACASYLLIASARTFVPKEALVAWINQAREQNSCFRFSETGDPGAPRLQEGPCASPSLDAGRRPLKGFESNFYHGRIIVSPWALPPESIAVRKILKRKFDSTGKYPTDVYWTWNPRFYASTIRTKIFYESYPLSQDEVDAIVARLGLSLSVIYDP
jgi:hypothetical protein